MGKGVGSIVSLEYLNENIFNRLINVEELSNW